LISKKRGKLHILGFGYKWWIFFWVAMLLWEISDMGEYLGNLALNAKIFGIGFNQWD